MHRPPHRYEGPNRIELVKATIARLENGWNHRNAYLWASAFTNPCQYIDAAGHYHRNWTAEQNARLHEQVWSTAYANSHARFLLESIEFMDDHHCIVILLCTITYEAEGKEHALQTYVTATLVHLGQDWSIWYFQNTPVRPRAS